MKRNTEARVQVQRHEYKHMYEYLLFKFVEYEFLFFKVAEDEYEYIAMSMSKKIYLNTSTRMDSSTPSLIRVMVNWMVKRKEVMEATI